MNNCIKKMPQKSKCLGYKQHSIHLNAPKVKPSHPLSAVCTPGCIRPVMSLRWSRLSRDPAHNNHFQIILFLWSLGAAGELQTAPRPLAPIKCSYRQTNNTAASHTQTCTLLEYLTA